MKQQEYLKLIMSELELTREEFATRLCCPIRTLNKWLLPDTSNDSREMSATMWAFLREIQAHEKLKKQHSHTLNKNP